MNETEQREFDETYKNQDTLRAMRAKALPLPWTTTEGEFVLYTDHKLSLTVDDVIRDQVENWYADGWAHRAVWHGFDLVAVVRPAPAGGPGPEVIRLDGPSPVVIRPEPGPAPEGDPEPDGGDRGDDPGGEPAAASLAVAVSRWETARALVARHNAAVAGLAAAGGRGGPGMRRLEDLLDAAVSAEIEAEQAVCEAVALLDPSERWERLYTLGYRWPTRAAVYGGRLFVSVERPRDEDDAGDKPLLAVVDMDQVRTAGDPAPAPA